MLQVNGSLELQAATCEAVFRDQFITADNWIQHSIHRPGNVVLNQSFEFETCVNKYLHIHEWRKRVMYVSHAEVIDQNHQ